MGGPFDPPPPLGRSRVKNRVEKEIETNYKSWRHPKDVLIIRSQVMEVLFLLVQSFNF